MKWFFIIMTVLLLFIAAGEWVGTRQWGSCPMVPPSPWTASTL